MKYIFSASAALLLAAFSMSAAPGDALVDGYHDMYDLRFEAAHQVFQNYEHANPSDPMGPASDAAAYLFFEFERLNVLRSEFFSTNNSFLEMKKLKADPGVKRDFDAALAKSKQLADVLHQKDPGTREAMLADVIRMALHADYLALIEKDNWNALQEIKLARTEADALLKKYPDCYDAYLAVGVENYLLSQKMAPVRFFLRMTGAQTDKQEGLQKLRLVADKGYYFKPYAKILLAIAAIRDQNRPEAVGWLKQLSGEFPRNGLFQDELKKICQAKLPACANS